MKKRRLVAPWPFPYSVLPGKGGIVENLPPKPKKPTKLRKVAPSSEWKQEALL